MEGQPNWAVSQLKVMKTLVSIDLLSDRRMRSFWLLFLKYNPEVRLELEGGCLEAVVALKAN